MTMIPPIDQQTSFWNNWNASQREGSLSEVSRRQSEEVVGWLQRENRNNIDILEVGCGACWFAPDLMRYGNYTGTDLSDELLNRASLKHPKAKFVAGDFGLLDLGEQAYDVIVTLEVLSHVADQSAFVTKLARHLKSGGRLMMATQNRPALQMNGIDPPEPGQLRHWVGRRELAELLAPHFAVKELFSVTPRFNRGPLRILNSAKLNNAVSRVAPGAVRLSKKLQEKLGLGWTLMVLAQKR